MQILYMVKRDKKGVKLLGTMKNDSTHSLPHIITKIADELKDFDNKVKFELENFVFKNRMDYELILQDFKNFDDFVEVMKNSGFKGIPYSAQPIFFSNAEPLRILKKFNDKKMLQRNSRK